MSRPFWVAFCAYLLPTFPLGYFWHLVVFGEEYHNLHMYRDDVIVPMGISSMIIQALFYAWAYPRLFSATAGDWKTGALRFGLVFFALAWSFTALPVAAKYKMASVQDFMVLETSFNLLQYAVVSPLIALAYRKVSR
ncbi:MAG: hypothetical protein HQK86_09625 [Nitrospinae bacterium]|nr:hypothetical protein [Nitrospinota bacterium]